MLRSTTRKAFTLIELIVVIVILGILALIAIPTFAKVIAKSKESTALRAAEAFGREAIALGALEGRSVPNSADYADALADSPAGRFAAGSDTDPSDKTASVIVNSITVNLSFQGTSVTATTGVAAPAAIVQPTIAATSTTLSTAADYGTSDSMAVVGSTVFFVGSSSASLMKYDGATTNGARTAVLANVSIVGTHNGTAFALSKDKTTISFLNAAGTVTKSVNVVGIQAGVNLMGAASDGTYLYFANNNGVNASIYRVPATGGTALVTQGGVPTDGNVTFAVDSRGVYIGAPWGGTTIRRIPVTSTSPTEFTVGSPVVLGNVPAGANRTLGAILSGDHLYYTVDTKVYDMDVTTGVSTLKATGGPAGTVYFALATNGTTVFAVDYNGTIVRF